MSTTEIPGVLIELPSEPERNKVIEARGPEGGMWVAWRYNGAEKWKAFAGHRSEVPEDWANIVEAAIRNRWRLFACEPGEPLPHKIKYR